MPGLFVGIKIRRSLSVPDGDWESSEMAPYLLVLDAANRETAIPP